MQNINPIFILQPILTILIPVALMIYWHRKRRFHINVWLYSLAAYAIAIALKYAVQIPTAVFFEEASPYVAGLYVGLQTVLFEVGLAYLFARFAINRGKMTRQDTEAYGSGLGFWESVGFIGILGLINTVSIYALLSNGGTLAETVYTQLMEVQPELFASDATALALVGLGVLERISSLLIHLAWGYLCFMAVFYRKNILFTIVLPMGMIDFLVLFAPSEIIISELALFEAVVFALAVASVLVAWFATKRVLKGTPPPPATTTPSRLWPESATT